MKTLAIGRLTLLATPLAVFAIVLPARSNPMVTEGAHGLQVPQSFHAQVTWYCASGFGSCVAPGPLQRDGTTLSLAWQQASVSTNTGSGVTGVTAFQVCDCNLAVATYQYLITPAGGASDYGPPTYTVPVTIVDPPPGPQASPDVSGADLLPWDEPDPPWPQGVDCVAWCANPPVPETVPDTPTADVPNTELPAADAVLPDQPYPPTDIATDLPAATDVPMVQDVPPIAQPDSGSSNGCIAGVLASPAAGLPFALACALLALTRLRRRRES